MLLGIDVGTTHCKTGLFAEDGSLLAHSILPSPVKQDADGFPYYQPDVLWQVVRRTIDRVTRNHALDAIKAVGVASMAETGLLLDRQTGAPRTNLLPWYSKQAHAAVSTLIDAAGDLAEHFSRRGIRPNYKCSLTKILWIKENDPALLDGAIWLSAADYIVYRLTGQMATDYSLAGRTFAFRIDSCEWDEDWLAQLGLPLDLFAPAHPSGTPFPATESCLAEGTTVSIAGHDHVCAAFAAGAISPDTMLDSMGTAETLLGIWDGKSLGQREFESGLLFGCHVIPGMNYWMGSLSASGGSIEWLRGIFNDKPMSYETVDALLESVQDPTGILYFPYLSGSSTNSFALASFIGLTQSHTRAHLLKAALEGAACEMEYIRETVESILHLQTKRILVVGGGTRSPVWIQVKADVSGCDHHIHPLSEATIQGAAMVAGLGAGVYQHAEAAVQAVNHQDMKVIQPIERNHRRYRQLYTGGYLQLMQPLQAYYSLISDGTQE